MAPKRTRDEDSDATKSKKPRTGFRVGPENLPDGAWKRKVTKIKKNLIQKAKIKKEYAKVKAQIEAEKEKHPVVNDPMLLLDAQEEEKHHHPEHTSEDNNTNDQPAPPSPQLHPSRQAMLDNPPTPASAPTAALDGSNPNLDDPTHPDRQPRRQQRKKLRPDYYSKELSAAQKAKEAAEKRQAEIERREKERQARIADRERFRKQMAKAKAPGFKDGKRKVGRESKLLLDRVQRIVGEGK
ncbi:hypothetical protein QBC38DRAFT_470328 [Podospora fimiseda]|uniref:rRNA-processing protein FYV7 n=1 Tax=Podospora fimiseda TaxID=252190 RepID=A0AAN7BUR3_9PEZI|nr:hypothetical protein QBC38DRAFT_470328 [Podospora fimiseda]